VREPRREAAECRDIISGFGAGEKNYFHTLIGHDFRPRDGGHLLSCLSSRYAPGLLSLSKHFSILKWTFFSPLVEI